MFSAGPVFHCAVATRQSPGDKVGRWGRRGKKIEFMKQGFNPREARLHVAAGGLSEAGNITIGLVVTFQDQIYCTTVIVGELHRSIPELKAACDTIVAGLVIVTLFTLTLLRESSQHFHKRLELKAAHERSTWLSFLRQISPFEFARFDFSIGPQNARLRHGAVISRCPEGFAECR